MVGVEILFIFLTVTMNTKPLDFLVSSPKLARAGEQAHNQGHRDRKMQGQTLFSNSYGSENRDQAYIIQIYSNIGGLRLELNACRNPGSSRNQLSGSHLSPHSTPTPPLSCHEDQALSYATEPPPVLTCGFVS